MTGISGDEELSINPVVLYVYVCITSGTLLMLADPVMGGSHMPMGWRGARLLGLKNYPLENICGSDHAP